ncbi:MAG: protein-glutamate O-methyltransferase CheR [Gemmatimonadaceae bacterium]|nr:protein-glutamate O-methyltransferase CheR [Gemmatimonadaceae bacterium]
MTGPDDELAAFRALLGEIERSAGLACTNYKDGCLRRRIAVRMRASGSADFTAYTALLRREPAELERLVATLTINVTRLYRDAPVWDLLAERVLPAMWAMERAALTVWSAGCASGEEAYTLAALLHRHAERVGAADRLRGAAVIGTDIDADSLRAAAAGRFVPEALVEVPVALRNRYFGAEPPHAATAELRSLVRFERRDLLLETPPARAMQLITCRNVLIYVERQAQEPVLQRFHDALVPGGFLVLGKVETMLGPARALFEVVDQRQRIFRKRAAA